MYSYCTMLTPCIVNLIKNSVSNNKFTVLYIMNFINNWFSQDSVQLSSCMSLHQSCKKYSNKMISQQ